jgi:SpoVK/Ycf46/Vps4 family AAA+-type ATPase
VRPHDRSSPGNPAQGLFNRARDTLRKAPFGLKVILLVVAVMAAIVAAPFLLLAVLGYAIIAVVEGRRNVMASLSVATWGVAVAAIGSGGYRTALIPLLVLPFAVALAAHAAVLARWYVPCRTVAWTLLWAIPAGVVALRIWPALPVIGPAAAWLLAFVIMGWRLAQALQDERVHGRTRIRGNAVAAAPHGYAYAAHPGDAMAREQVQGGDSAAGRPKEREPGAAEAALPVITVDDAMAELASMIGLEPVKEQIRSIAAWIEARRIRALAGYATEKPMRHFVLLGPPGTGKTTVARVIAKVFYAFGLLETPYVIEAQRADLVGEYLGATAIKTNELVDSALGGVLFIDEAYSLVNEGDGQADRFGNEAVQALLKRAEDDREDLIIILAGYEKQMEDFLASNPGLASRFATRIKFPSYSPAELLQIAESCAERRGDVLDADARPALWRMFEDVARRRIVDDLGNGRFVRSLVEKAAEARDLRVMAAGPAPDPADLISIRAPDTERAYAELTSRFRGYEQTPTLTSALAELDSLVGLEPVKQQVRAIAAQLQVAGMRQRQGLASKAPARHFVFTGPPGTGKTTVARILGRVFAALGLLARPTVVEAHRGDFVGEHLGATAVKTNKLVDSALGGVLLVDEAYSLNNSGYAGGDAFGAEAIQTLLKRAEDDRDRLVVVLTGYSGAMETFLVSNQGLASRFATRVRFPSYSAVELQGISAHLAAEAGDSFDPDALAELGQIFGEICAQGRVDELGNGRFARTLFERACAHRDLRVARLGDAASAAELTTVTGADIRAAWGEFTSG